MTSSIKMRPKVLLVDSDYEQLKALENLLEPIQCDIYKASTGMDAFEIALKYSIDLFISEVFLPLLDGATLVKEVRKLHYGKDSIFIFLTNAINQDSVVKCIDDGADDVVIKPINDAIFKTKIKGLLNRIAENHAAQKSIVQKNLNADIGEILYCKVPNARAKISDTHLSINSVSNFCELKEVFDSRSIWMVFIDSTATWATSSIHKIIHQIGVNTPIWLLASRTTTEKMQAQFIESGGFGIIQKHRNQQIITSQINALVNREINLKNQYVNSIKQAVQSSPVHFASEYEESFSDFDLKIKYEPFTKPAGGDFYEIVKLNNNHTLILLGDVMGKRWGAWFFANAYLAYIRASLKVFPAQRQFEIGNNIGLLVSEINQFLYKDIQLSDAFTTLIALLIIPEKKIARISAAGAIYPILHKSSEKKNFVIPVTGKILGIVENEKYTSVDVSYSAGDKIMLFTDGYTEAYDTVKDRFVGIEKISATLEMPLNRGITSMKKFEQAIVSNNSIEAFNDDRTMMLIDFK